MLSHKDAVINKIQLMREDDFSRDIVIPLLQRMGYTFTDFNGGAYELGKDVIAHKRNEFDEVEVAAVQSKKLKLERTSEDSVIFGQITHQLRMCVGKKIACIDGVERYPSKVIFITPFSIDTRHLTEQLENIQVDRIILIDEARLRSLLDKFWPEIFSSAEAGLIKAIGLAVNDTVNIELYRALHIDSKTNYSDYYSDLNFFVGQTESRRVFGSSAKLFSKISPPYSQMQWDELKKVNSVILGLIGVGVVVESVSEVELVYDARLQEFYSAANQEGIKLNCELTRSVDSAFRSLEHVIDEAWSSSKANLISALSRGQDGLWRAEAENLDELVAEIKAIPLSSESLTEIFVLAKSISVKNLSSDSRKLGLQIENIAQLGAELIGLVAEQIKVSSGLFLPPLFNASVDLLSAELLLDSKIKTVSADLRGINESKLTAVEMRRVLDDTNKLLRSIDQLASASPETPVGLRFIDLGSDAHDFDVSVHKIFDSGANIAIYGDAGAGKSTTLYVYAEKIYKNKSENEEVLFIPLNRISNALGKLAAEERNELIKSGNDFESLLNAFLLYRGAPVTAEARAWVVETLSRKNKTTIIVDALDEAVANASWVISALSEIPNRIKNSQVITSSRNSVGYIKNIQFLGVTLLPFNKDQLKKFIFGWMKSNQSAEGLWADIEESGLSDVARNPLLATIICTLHESGIPLPENEPDVYRRKIELLCGLYDQNKGIRRTKNERSFLETCAQKIAYQMHARQQREATQEEVFNYLYLSFESRLDKEKVCSVIEDLIDSCNILIRSPGTDYYSFGHLRIQEALAAEEIARNRAIDIVGLCLQPWWGGALYLYSFKNSIQPLMDSIYDRYGGFSRVAQNLVLMISSQPAVIRAELKLLLRRHMVVDRFSDSHQVGYEGDDGYHIDSSGLKDILGY